MQRKHLVLIAISLLMSAGLFVIVRAQEVPIPLPSQPETSLNQQTENPIPTAELTGNMILKGYRLIYLVADGAVPADHVVAPAKVHEDTGAIIANNWETLLNTEAQAPLDAVIIHKSALPFVDYDWVSSAYKNGVVISLIDIYFPELPEVMGFNCTDTPTEPFYEKNFFITYHFHIYAPIREDREKIIEAVENCTTLDDVAIQGLIMLSRGRSQETLEGDYGSRLFYGSVQTALMGREETYRAGAMQDPNATSGGEN